MAVSRSRRLAKIERDRDDVGLILRVDSMIEIALAGERGEATFVFCDGVVVRGVEMVRVAVSAETLDFVQSGLNHDAAGFVFFGGDCALTGEAERANERRQGKALQDERHENHAKRQKDNQVALREGAAIGKSFGQRQGRG